LASRKFRIIVDVLNRLGVTRKTSVKDRQTDGRTDGRTDILMTNAALHKFTTLRG